MKYEKLIMGIVSIMVITGAIMRIFHLPFASTILGIGFVGGFAFQFWLVTQLKKKIKELEGR